MKKKILLIVPMLHQGGFERVCVTTARLLEPYFEVTIVVFNAANIAYDISGLRILDLGLGAKKGKFRKLLTMIRRVQRVKKIKKEMCPEVAYSFGPTANLVNAFSKTSSAKVWLGLRNYTDVEEKIKIRLFLQKADLMICCSKRIEEELHTVYGFHKTTTIYNLYDIDTIRREACEKEPELPWSDEGHYLLSMGRDADQKGFWHMLKVFAKVREVITDVRLIILGAGSFDTYRRLALELGIGEAVYFAGMQTAPYRYLRKGSIYLLTSSNEGFPNALVEGMVLGLAAVSVDCKTGPAEILLAEPLSQQEREDRYKEEKAIWGEFGILLPPMSGEKNLDAACITKEEENMAEVVIRLLSDGRLLEGYQKAAVMRAGIFSYEAYREKILCLLKGTP